MMPAGRVFREKRGLMLPLIAALAINAALLVLAVLPLMRSVRAEEARAVQAAGGRAAAEQALARAEAIAGGKTRADEELLRFYEQVLPQDFTGARRVAYLNLQQLARQAGLQLAAQSTAPQAGALDASPLRKYTTELTLSGSYRGIRQFIHAIETQPNFLVIESVVLAAAAGQDEPLRVSLRIATYYKAGDGL